MQCAYCGHTVGAVPLDCEGCGRHLTMKVGLHHRYSDLPHQAPNKDPNAYVLQGPQADIERAALTDIEKAEDAALMLAH